MQAYTTSARIPGAWLARARRSFAIVAIAAAAAACSDKNSTGPDDPGTPSTPVPSQLAGEWMYGTISPSNFWNDHTGQYSGNAYGIGVYLQFKPEGRYSQWVYIYTQQYSCRTQTWTYTEGTVTVSGSQISFYPSKGKYQASDNCVASHNFERPMTASELQAKQGETWGWQIDDSSGQPKLYTGPGGPSEFRRPG
jgi:hypothetical protein